ncbi:protein of unknown function [Methylotuvimicrobium alcaliphilum 20Z]|uniref:Uncharacterized protein n=1 Tax=Methylotuvimicrobium alcaliphilum (strain DSM 19304 / NCIMB 14124 / VKM B-2133 / 20Z) TaxID=1091494 RepID=G4T1H8_META2|nr:protein of unknown function [Methylotuvimicrobium alcaliphilum 20Z]
MSDNKPLAILLDNGNFFGLWAFLTLSHDKLNFLAFSQGLETGTRNVAEMNENVRTLALLDEAEAFVCVEPFNCACCSSRHTQNLKNKKLNQFSPKADRLAKK